MIDLEILKQTVLRTDGKINSAVLRQSWFTEGHLWRDICKDTQFLDVVYEEVSPRLRVLCVLQSVTEVPLCAVCGTSYVLVATKANTLFAPTCNNKSCVRQHCRPLRDATMMERYGSLMSEKGKASARQRIPELNAKGRQTIRERYGVQNPGQLAGHLEKVSDTMLSRYGVTHMGHLPSSRKAVSNRRQEAMQQLTEEVVVTSVESTSKGRFKVTYECIKCGQHNQLHDKTYVWRATNLTTPCFGCSGMAVGSVKQYEVYQFVLQALGGDAALVYQNDRMVLPKLELDLYIPSVNLAIEFDGVFWHSFNTTETTEQRNKHLTKTKLCEERGIKLIHIFESEWDSKQEVVKSRLLSALNKTTTIYARKCRAEPVASATASAFLKTHHLQGSGAPTSVNYGLYHNQELVAVMTFGKPRYDTTAEWELIRYGTRHNISISGGASKLFSMFVKQYGPQEIISYADRRYSQSGHTVYDSLGFEFVHATAPSYYYFNAKSNDYKLLNRIHYQKGKLAQKLEVFDSTLTEAENMFANGFRRIWDCGMLKYSWKRSVNISSNEDTING